uniref:Type III secretion system protein n=1 Tax=Meloidogyne hapla TaxID=6305 RepID=A0A1I8C1S3_MELHA
MLSTESQSSSNFLNSSLTVPGFYKINNQVESTPTSLIELREGLGPDNVLLQFNNIQLKLSNGTVTSHLDIPSLRSFCSSQDVSDFAKTLAEYIAELDYAPM